ncbi:unnamed protein product [Notodromas monacha]|uniref:Oxysterol-binding protein n=1 Tax=Notodromas monacha TaxID=399045 RepID=A0A7R9GB06_9CRUS|nr:unnamed protein product [Notodromas monacha]CAG0914540.1 unnamed protein product [Notodromas monacha]
MSENDDFSAMERAIIRKSLDGFMDDLSGTPVTEPMPRDDRDARKALPAKNKHKTIGLLTLMKHSIGKDLTHITMPLIINEPLSLLQRLAEGLEYGYLLNKADATDDPHVRMELVMAFCVSGLSSSKDRTLKPFNPLLGETFQWEKYGIKLVSEQVCHHPPVSAFHAVGQSFTLYANLQPSIKFWGRSIEIQSKGHNVVFLNKHKEHYYWESVPVLVKNIFLGTTYLEYGGTYKLHKHNSCNRGSDPSMSKSRRIPFRRNNSKGAKTLATSGDSEKRILFRMRARPPKASDYFNYGYFTLMLNELRITDEQQQQDNNKLCPTDSRFRPDMRLLEQGKEDKGQEEKDRIEDIQRARRKQREDAAAATSGSKSQQQSAYKPRWFVLKKDEITKTEMWVYDESSHFWKKTYENVPNLWKIRERHLVVGQGSGHGIGVHEVLAAGSRAWGALGCVGVVFGPPGVTQLVGCDEVSLQTGHEAATPTADAGQADIQGLLLLLQLVVMPPAAPFMAT